MSDPAVDNAQSAGELPDLYSMSDEEIMNLDPSQFVTDEAPELEDEAEETPADEAADTDAADLLEEEGGEEEASEAEDAGEAGESEAEESEQNEEGESEEPEEKAEGDEKDEASDESPDYEAEYKKILAPFKANGKEMQVESADEAIQLMQMGANYNKKMAALKPHLKTLKVLEKNGLLSDEQVGFLVDLSKRDPKAIGKLIKDSGIDPLDMDVDASGDYVPSKHTVSDQELALDDVLDEIQESSKYGETVELVSKQWDETSKKAVAQEPGLLKVINQHMESGVYDVIRTELDRQRMLGKVNGLSDLEAYKQVGDSIQARGGFDHLFKKEEQGQQNTPPAKRLPPKQKQEDPKLKEKRRAAAAAKGAPAKSATPKDFNPLAMSDEEFEKQFSQKLL